MENNIIYKTASLSDVQDIINLLDQEVKKGVILYRSASTISQNIRCYIIAKKDDNIIGVGALHIYAQELGELRSLMVDEKFRNCGIARNIIKKIITMAKELNLQQILVLTFKDRLFKKMGFEFIQKENLPEYKIWQDCIKCKMFPKCEEISLIKTI